MMENEKLRQNLLDQLDRLVRQLADLEDFKEDLDQSEYADTRRETLAQMEEFSATLTKISAGNVSLMDDVSTMKLALQAAISEAFKTPLIIRLFASKQPAQLRLRLAELERDYKFRKCPQGTFDQQKLEILAALQKLSDPLTPAELAFLADHNSVAMGQFETAAERIMSEESVLSTVGRQIHS